MCPVEIKSYAPAYEIGKRISNSAACKVLLSLLPAEIVDTAVKKIDNKYYAIDPKMISSSFLRLAGP
jgi:hypothetical protein